MEISLILALAALASVATLLFFNLPRPFRPHWRVSGIRCWSDQDKLLRLDLQLTLANTGDQAGWLNTVVLKLDADGRTREVAADSFWKSGDLGTIRRSADFHPLFLPGNQAITRRVGFSTGQIIDLFPEGERDLVISASLYPVRRPRRRRELSLVSSFQLDKKAARREGAGRQKKTGDGPLQTFNWEMIRDILQGKRKKEKGITD